jgi:LmbE family N-acetylglucosaminyl deacetylase
MNLFLAPHPDDEGLFGTFTLIREKPLVVICTDSWIQFNRGEDITADQRWEETKEAMKLLDCAVIRLGIRDDCVDEWVVKDKFSRFEGFQTIYAPAIQGGNPQHDLIGRIAKEIFGEKTKQYTTYSPTELYTTGTFEIVPTPEELELKNRVLTCYKSQIKLVSTAPHFEAVSNKPEWYI